MGHLASKRVSRGLIAALALGTLISACSAQVTRHGYIAEEGALSQIELGSSREQVRLIMGTPSTTAAIGNEVYFYVSQTKEQVLFLEPEVVDQRVLTFYFADDGRLERIANYGLQDGKVFDFISRTTPTRGDDLTVLRQILGNIGNINPFNP
ncbi:MAG: outer membrane protein assembly factor BamE [Hyphomicrobiales bacterium]|jgi:outer membrane protein assembly factor BamE (lipoprotein component of BamABCDE complex)|nr:outer membrane protein assembly factor BamE [Hyphomicrobiales bacterium]